MTQRLPNWDELTACSVITQGQADDLRVDTGDFRIWTSRMSLEDGAPFEHTVTIEMKDEDDRWIEADKYDGDDPPYAIPGVTARAFRGEVDDHPEPLSGVDQPEVTS